MAIIFLGGRRRLLLFFSNDSFSFDLFSPYWANSLNASLGYTVILQAP